MAIVICAIVTLAIVLLVLVSPYWLLCLLLVPALYWLIRRRTKRRLQVIAKPFPDHWEAILQQDVAFFRALDVANRDRFRQMVTIFLDETPVTGIRTEVDPRTQVLVAASAVIPVFGFDDWEYRRPRRSPGLSGSIRPRLSKRLRRSKHFGNGRHRSFERCDDPVQTRFDFRFC